jgi:hypothetical protein
MQSYLDVEEQSTGHAADTADVADVVDTVKGSHQHQQQQ